MGMLVCMGAMCLCSFGTAPSAIVVTPENMVLGCALPAATIMDNIPMKNIMPFAMCLSLANPQVASATSAACGVLTPMPCVPTIPAPWAPGCPTVMIAKKPALNMASKLTCTWGGVINIIGPSQVTVQVPG